MSSQKQKLNQIWKNEDFQQLNKWLSIVDQRFLVTLINYEDFGKQLFVANIMAQLMVLNLVMLRAKIRMKILNT